MYVAIEGIKGVGKTSVVECLCKKLSYHHVLFTQISPTKPMPQNTWWEKAFKIFNHDDAFLEHLYANRSNYHATKVDWNIDLIIGDRSIFTSLMVRWERVHDGLDANEFFSHVRQLEYKIAIPDIVIKLNVDNAILLERYSKRQRKYGQYEENIDNIIRLQNNYNDIEKWVSLPETNLLLGKKIKWINFDCKNYDTNTIASMIFDGLINSMLVS